MALHVVLTYICWTLYRIMHSVYALVLIEPLHPPASVNLQMNYLSTSGEESSPFSTAQKFHRLLKILHITQSLIVILKIFLNVNQIRFLL